MSFLDTVCFILMTDTFFRIFSFSVVSRYGRCCLWFCCVLQIHNRSTLCSWCTYSMYGLQRYCLCRCRENGCWEQRRENREGGRCAKTEQFWTRISSPRLDESFLGRTFFPKEKKRKRGGKPRAQMISCVFTAWLFCDDWWNFHVALNDRIGVEAAVG